MTKKIQYKGNIIEFPDNVTNEEIVDFLKNQDIPKKTKPVDAFDRARLVGQGVTLGFGDEIVAGAKALNPFSDKTYSEAVKEERDKIANFRQARPKESIALELAGGLLSPVGSLGLVAKAPTTAKRLTELAKEGAKVGGIYGVGTGEGVVDSAESGLKSALTGAVANPIIGKVASKLKPKQTPESARVQEKFGEEPTELRKLGGAFQTVDELTESIPIAGGMLKKSRETKLSKSLNSLINNSVEKGTGKTIPRVKKLDPEEAVQKGREIYGDAYYSVLPKMKLTSKSEIQQEIDNTLASINTEFPELGKQLQGKIKRDLNKLIKLVDADGIVTGEKLQKWNTDFNKIKTQYKKDVILEDVADDFFEDFRKNIFALASKDNPNLLKKHSEIQAGYRDFGTFSDLIKSVKPVNVSNVKRQALRRGRKDQARDAQDIQTTFTSRTPNTGSADRALFGLGLIANPQIYYGAIPAIALNPLVRQGLSVTRGESARTLPSLLGNLNNNNK